MKHALLYSIAILFLLPACKKTTPIPTVEVNINLEHMVGQQALQVDTLAFTNDAGNHFSVTRLEYYLSDFHFEDVNGQLTTIDDVFYVNARKPETHSIKATLPAGDYRTLSFYLGLPSAKNVSYTLPATADNVNMAWPEVMGGGYHFMKLEGHYFDEQNSEKGYAMHLGMNEWLITVLLNQNLVFNPTSSECTLTMDISEWFKNPHTYDFLVQGNYTMGIDSLMQQLSENGTSAFRIKQNP